MTVRLKPDSMMLRALFIVVVLATRTPAQSSLVAPAVVLAPVTDAIGVGVTARAPNGALYPVFRVAERTLLVRQVYQVLEHSVAQEVIKLDRYARRYALGARTGSLSSTMLAPVYLLMSGEEGGYSRHGFWLQGVKGDRRVVDAGYVDLVVSSESVKSGNFEETFSHELGHQVLRDLVGELPLGRSRNMHQSMAVTDYVTAFDEGFAEHFQPVVRDGTANPRVQTAQKGMTSADLDILWISRLDQQLRTDGVKHNVFIHSKTLPPATLDSAGDLYALYLQDETSTAFADDELRGGQEMMASEGVIATLFYRMVNSRTLREHRRDADFYKPFLDPGAWAARFTPYENANLKLFVAMHRAAREIASSTPPMIAVVRQYATAFPDEAHAIYSIFLETTRGATASRALARSFERASAVGRRGNVGAFQASSKAAFALLDSTIDRVTRGVLAVDAAVGPELWLLNDDFRIAEALWSDDRSIPFALNLNTASEVDLLTVPGMDLPTAHHVVALRRSRGSFGGLDDLTGVVPAALYRRLVAMRDAMAAAGPYRRR